MPTTIQAALLGLVQGLTEFLPVSSSAHLILARLFFGFDADQFGLAFDVACHAGALIAVLIYFRTDVMRMIAALPRLGWITLTAMVSAPKLRVHKSERAMLLVRPVSQALLAFRANSSFRRAERR